MAKTSTSFVCQNCGHQSPKWIGKCPECGSWNSFQEEIQIKEKKSSLISLSQDIIKSVPILIDEIAPQDDKRIIFKDKELTRVLGGGLVKGSLVLLGGEPGIGKSTLLLQIALEDDNLNVLYVSGEESPQQIKLRADRIKNRNKNCSIYSETNIEQIISYSINNKPDILVIDSIQTLHSSEVDSFPGSITQIRGCASILINFSKTTNTPIFIIGHITKDGVIAGPKILEHMVDTVLQFEGDKNYYYRILRSIKNRFGSTNEIGIYEMSEKGLQEVANPSQVLISDRDDNLSGICVSATIEGGRPILIEVQALVSSAVYGNPQRSSIGFDVKRLNMLLAVLEKRCGFRLATKDVFLNITGGIKVSDPAIDLAVVCAVLSSDSDIPISRNVCLAGEIGLSGEIRPVTKISQRIAEAKKLGFNEIYTYLHKNDDVNKNQKDVNIKNVKKIEQVFGYLFG